MVRGTVNSRLVPDAIVNLRPVYHLGQDPPLWRLHYPVFLRSGAWLRFLGWSAARYGQSTRSCTVLTVLRVHPTIGCRQSRLQVRPNVQKDKQIHLLTIMKPQQRLHQSSSLEDPATCYPLSLRSQNPPIGRLLRSQRFFCTRSGKQTARAFGRIPIQPRSNHISSLCHSP